MIKINESEDMTIKYHSMGSNTMKTVTLPKSEVDELKASYQKGKSVMDKNGIKTFEDYVGLVLGFNN